MHRADDVTPFQVRLFEQTKMLRGAMLGRNDMNPLEEIQRADTERLAADWDYVWHNARQAYYQFQPAPDAADRQEPAHHDIIALEKRIECEKRVREDEKPQLVALLKAYLAVRRMGFDAIQDAIEELGSKTTTKEIKQIFELAVTKIDASDGQKLALLGFHAAGDFLLHWYAANVGKPTWSESNSKPGKPEKKSKAILWLAERFAELSGESRDFTTNARTVIRCWREGQKQHLSETDNSNGGK